MYEYKNRLIMKNGKAVEWAEVLRKLNAHDEQVTESKAHKEWINNLDQIWERYKSYDKMPKNIRDRCSRLQAQIDEYEGKYC